MSHRPQGVVVIDIEGVIGVPEDWQFDNDDQRVATYERFRAKLDEIKAIDAQMVKVNIRSRGGSVDDALMIYEALCSLDADIETVCHGYVASAATIIAQAGHERKVSTGTLYLIHRATMTVDGNSADIMHASSLLGKTDERIAQIYADRSGYPVEEFRELMSRDAGRGEWLSPEEVVAAGLADEIVNLSALSRIGRKIKELIVPPIVDARQGRTGSTNVSGLAPTVGIVAESEQSLSEMSEIQKNTTSTDTLAKEDPIIGVVSNRGTANQLAYNHDVEAFR